MAITIMPLSTLPAAGPTQRRTYARKPSLSSAISDALMGSVTGAGGGGMPSTYWDAKKAELMNTANALAEQRKSQIMSNAATRGLAMGGGSGAIMDALLKADVQGEGERLGAENQLTEARAEDERRRREFGISSGMDWLRSGIPGQEAYNEEMAQRRQEREDQGLVNWTTNVRAPGMEGYAHEGGTRKNPEGMTFDYNRNKFMPTETAPTYGYNNPGGQRAAGGSVPGSPYYRTKQKFTEWAS